jgi:hypothetical protein
LYACIVIIVQELLLKSLVFFYWCPFSIILFHCVSYNNLYRNNFQVTCKNYGCLNVVLWRLHCIIIDESCCYQTGWMDGLKTPVIHLILSWLGLRADLDKMGNWTPVCKYSLYSLIFVLFVLGHLNITLRKKSIHYCGIYRLWQRIFWTFTFSSNDIGGCQLKLNLYLLPGVGIGQLYSNGLQAGTTEVWFVARVRFFSSLTQYPDQLW